MKEILKINKNTGFVLLFAVTLAAIILSITLGITNVAYNEVRFSSNARDTNDAFFAADSGLECAGLYDVYIYDGSTSFAFLPFPYDGISDTTFRVLNSISCNNVNSININASRDKQTKTYIYTFAVPNLGAGKNSCAIVSVKKTGTNGNVVTYISSKGYNNDDSNTCNGSSSSRLEREVHIKYP